MAAGEEYAIGNKGLKLTVLTAYHDETLSEDYSVGLLFTLPMEGDEKAKTLLFTSDTGYVPKTDGDDTPEDAPLQEIWQEYPVMRPDFFIPHMGSIKEQEFRDDLQDIDVFRREGKKRKVFYPNHLGFMGTAMLIRQMQARHVFVSEFGEELKDFLQELVVMLGECVRQLPCTQPESLLPMDLPFICDLAGEEIYSVYERKFIRLRDASFDKPDKADTFHYFPKSFSEDDRPQHDMLELRFEEMYIYIRDKRGLFFKPK